MPISQSQKLRMGWVWAAPVGPMGLTCRSPLAYPLTRCGVSLTRASPGKLFGEQLGLEEGHPQS